MDEPSGVGDALKGGKGGRGVKPPHTTSENGLQGWGMNLVFRFALSWRRFPMRPYMDGGEFHLPWTRQSTSASASRSVSTRGGRVIHPLGKSTSKPMHRREVISPRGSLSEFGAQSCVVVTCPHGLRGSVQG